MITDIQSALDFFATVDYETRCSRMIINKSSVCEEFFDLSTKKAEEMQKIINYRKKIAIIGDFSIYPSKKTVIHANSRWDKIARDDMPIKGILFVL